MATAHSRADDVPTGLLVLGTLVAQCLFGLPEAFLGLVGAKEGEVFSTPLLTCGAGLILSGVLALVSARLFWKFAALANLVTIFVWGWLAVMPNVFGLGRSWLVPSLAMGLHGALLAVLWVKGRRKSGGP